MKNQIGFLLLGVVIGYAISFIPSLDKPLKVGYAASAVTGSTLSCSGILSGAMEANPGFETKTYAQAQVKKTTEKASIKIDGDTLSFLNETSFENGRTEGSPMRIIKNDEHELMAVSIGDNIQLLSDSLNVFALYKDNGLAYWDKHMSKNPLVEGPTLDALYLKCS